MDKTANDNMRIDVHCHIFDSSCSPFWGILMSKLGFSADKTSKNSFSLKDFIDSFTNCSEVDSVINMLIHTIRSAGMTIAGNKSMENILKNMMENSGNHGVNVWVPLGMDFDFAYSNVSKKTSFDEQIQKMSELAKTYKGQVLPFYPFDPRRDNCVKNVKDAIERKGFIGVKLYPPLGFKPLGSSNTKLMDENLRALYQYCSDNELPITTHTCSTGGVYSNIAVAGVSSLKEYYRAFAQPKNWKIVFDEFSALKVNFAHFGGFVSWRDKALQQPSNIVREWAEDIVSLIKNVNNGDNNIYTDLSFHGLKDDNLIKGYKRLLDELFTLHPKVKERLMLGSDWYLTALQCDLDKIWSGFKTLFNDKDFKTYARDNTVRFLSSKIHTL